MADNPKVRGVGRQAVGMDSLDVFFDRPLSDDDMRRFHEFVRGFGGPNIIVHAIEPQRPIFAVMDGGRCRHCGAPR